MKHLGFPALSLLALAVGGVPGIALAQTWSTQAQPQSDADRLAAAMRMLGSNPQHVESLITAGELSLRLGDAAGAAALFARAEKVDPRNGRVKAGMASILVHEERPGEALRYFNMAEGYGLDPARFAAERGLAYDLVGEQERAQRDYRVALRSGQNDEVLRRYALSLGISGKKDEALAQIDPLVRKNDRGAWRARAFVLAMSGDVADANKIATTMFPGGMAQGLSAFFERLPRLAAVDRAFAVHFGEVRPTPQRLADARLMPALPVLGPEPGRQTMMASVVAVQPPAPKTAAERRREERERKRAERQQRIELARAERTRRTAPAAAPVATAATAATPRALTPGRVTMSPASSIASAAVRRPASAPLTVPATTRAAVAPANAPTVAAATLPARGTVPAATTGTMLAAADGAPRYPGEGSPAASLVAASNAAPLAARPVTTPASTATPGLNAFATGGPAASTATAAPATSLLASTATPLATARAAPVVGATSSPMLAVRPTFARPATVAARGPAATVARPAAPAARAVAAAPLTTAAGTDSILAKIIAGISVPASELEARPTPVPVRTARAAAPARPIATGTRAAAPASAPATGAMAGKAKVELADARPVTRRLTAAERRKAQQAEAEAASEADDEATPKTGRNAKTATAKTAADKKAADKKTADKKAAAKKADSDASRIWVQVAGGANDGDLAKAWRAQQGKAAALKGRDAYSTPLRATNRVVTGPFKTDAEARAFVNTLAKQGVSAFPFTSDKGQKMTKLGAK